jgi:hypothetical protein
VTARGTPAFERVDEIGKFRAPTLGEVDDAELVYLYRQVREWNIVNPDGNDELVVLERFLHRVRNRDFVANATPVWIAARLGDHHHDFDRLLPDRILDTTPERRSTREIEDVGPDFVAVAGQPGAEPADELVVVRGRVTDEDDVAIRHRTVACSGRAHKINLIRENAIVGCALKIRKTPARKIVD